MDPGLACGPAEPRPRPSSPPDNRQASERRRAVTEHANRRHCRNPKSSDDGAAVEDTGRVLQNVRKHRGPGCHHQCAGAGKGLRCSDSNPLWACCPPLKLTCAHPSSSAHRHGLREIPPPSRNRREKKLEQVQGQFQELQTRKPCPAAERAAWTVLRALELRPRACRGHRRRGWPCLGLPAAHLGPLDLVAAVLSQRGEAIKPHLLLLHPHLSGCLVEFVSKGSWGYF